MTDTSLDIRLLCFAYPTLECFFHKVTSPFGSSDHGVVTIKCKQLFFALSVPFHKTDVPKQISVAIPVSSGFRSDDVRKLCRNYTVIERLQIRIKAYIPHRSYQVKPLAALIYTRKFICICSMIISHACRRNRSADNLEQYRAARKHCKVTLREAKSRYALQVRDSTANQKLVSGFLKGVKKSMSEEKFIIPTLKNGLFEHRYGNLSRKVNFLSTQFAKNSTLVDGD